MTELVPLAHSGTDDFELELIRSAQADAPAPGAKLKLLAMVSSGAAVAGAAGVAHAAAVTVGGKAVTTGSAATTAAATQSVALGSVGKAATLSLVKWLGAGALAGTVLSAGATAVMPNRSARIEARTAAAVRPAPTGAQHAARTPALAPVDVPPPQLDETSEHVEAALPAASAGVPKPDVVNELKLLDDARKAVASGDARAALVALDARDAKHGAGTLGPEAEVLRVEALVASGQKQAAAARAQRFLSRHAGSPHAGRVRTLLARLRPEARAAAPAAVDDESEAKAPSAPSKASFGAAPAAGATPTASPPASKASFPTQ
jgi:hypothetical protein